MNTNRIMVIAHRGGSLLAPENTIAAFKNAISLGVDRIELDVQQTKDKITVVMHDRKIDRTTTGKGEVHSYTYDELCQFDAGRKFSDKFSNEKIPTLDEVLTFVNGQCTLLIEVKNHEDMFDGLEADVVRLIQKHRAQKWCVVQSFNYNSIHKVHQLDSTIAIGFLSVKVPRKKMELQPDDFNFISEINIYHRFATKKAIAYIHSQNKRTCVWTVNKNKRMQKLIEQAADGIMSDDPALLKDLLGK
ncbi:MAG: glycerophosphodiester phosphodiesterase family protein [Bacteroidota bacterium]